MQSIRHAALAALTRAARLQNTAPISLEEAEQYSALPSGGRAGWIDDWACQVTVFARILRDADAYTQRRLADAAALHTAQAEWEARRAEYHY